MPSRLGQLMNASHMSLRDDFEVSSRELNIMVECAEQQAGLLRGADDGRGLWRLRRRPRPGRIRAGFRRLGRRQVHGGHRENAPGPPLVRRQTEQNLVIAE